MRTYGQSSHPKMAFPVDNMLRRFFGALDPAKFQEQGGVA